MKVADQARRVAYIDLTAPVESLVLENTDRALELDLTDEVDLDVAALFVYHGRAKADAENAVRAACRAMPGDRRTGLYVEMYADPLRAGPDR